jgi:hypothetical protein
MKGLFNVIHVSSEVYSALALRAAGWGMEISEYTNRDLQRILFLPPAENRFAWACWAVLARKRVRELVTGEPERRLSPEHSARHARGPRPSALTS